MPDYLPSLSYPGSSGYSVYGGLDTGPRYPTASGRADYGVMHPDGTVVSILTGKPWNGREPRTGQMYQGGKQVTGGPGTVQVPGTDQFINPNDPNARYKPVSVTKQPDIAQGQTDLMKTFTDAASGALKDFNQYLASFKAGTGAAFSAGQKAADVTPTVAALGGAQQRYVGDLGATQTAYSNLLGQNAAAERGIVQQATDILPQYDLAAQAIGNRQLDALVQQNARYKMGSGTPTSLGGADAAILARAVADVNLPLQEQKIARQYGLLQNLALPVQNDITNRATQFLGQFNPAIANQIYSSAQGTAQQIQALKQIASTFGYDNALRYMQSIQIPAQIQQQVLSGQIGQLGQLSGLESLANYQGLQDVLGVYPSQPQGYSPGGPEYPNVPLRPPQYPSVPTGGGGAPVPVGPVQGPPPPGAYGMNAFGVPQYPGYAPPTRTYPTVDTSGAGGFVGDINTGGPVYG